MDVCFRERQGTNAGLITRVRNCGMSADDFIGYEITLEPVSQSIHLGRHRMNYDRLRVEPCDVKIGEWNRLEVASRWR